MTLVAGIDVGASGVKVAIMEVAQASNYGNEVDAKILGLRSERIRRRLPHAVTEENYRLALKEAGLSAGDIAYVASTGDGETIAFRTGHFYGMTTHARGALFLVPQSTVALDIGALHARAVLMDDHAKVLKYRMTSQCASGSGQFLENIARYLGVTLEEVGRLSCEADDPEVVSGICAVLAETDVINMVSRGISTANILKGIHDSMATRLIKLLGIVKAEGNICLTGGLSADVGLTQSLREHAAQSRHALQITTHPQALYAGAIGAALWGAFRHEKMNSIGSRKENTHV